MNQDLMENHFSKLRAANGQNDNPTYLLTQGTQNCIIFGQTTLSQKSNTGTSRNFSFAELPKENLFGLPFEQYIVRCSTDNDFVLSNIS